MAVDVTSLSSQLNTYAQWAEAASANATAGVNAAGVQSVPGRGISKAQAGQMRQAALDDFKKALTDTVGETLADQAWKSVGGDKLKGLTAGVVRATLDKANALLAKALSQPKGVLVDLLHASPEDVRSAVQNGAVQTSTVKATVALMRANSLLGTTPITGKQAQIFDGRLQDAMTQLMNCRGELGAPANDAERELATRLEESIRNLGLKANDVKASMGNLPNGAGAVHELANHWSLSFTDACKKIMGGLKNEIDNTTDGKAKAKAEKLHAKLYDLQNEYDSLRMENQLRSNAQMLGHGIVKFFAKSHYQIGTQLDKVLKSAISSVYGKSGLPAGVGSADKLVVKSHLARLNTAEWNPIKNTFTASLDGQSFQLESDITSGRHIKNTSIRSDYNPEVKAYNSHSQDTSNAVNLATSALKLTEADGTTRTVFRGVRHGVHCAIDIKDKGARAAANVTRAQQTVMAAFTTLFETQSKKFKDLAMQGLPIPINLTSVSLLTATNVASKEKTMLADQQAAWKAISGRPMEVTMGHTKYTVVPNVVSFNYGVDKFAVDSKLQVGWSASDPVNREGMAALRDRVGAYLANPKVPLADRKAVDTLWRQIREITAKGGEKSAGGDAYKVPARLAVMTSIMGDVPCWNCKSGKDRTGMLDVEAKFLATLIARGKDIPEPGAKLDEEQSKLLTTITMKSGNLEMQKYNTGIAGYKLYGGKSTFERLGVEGDKDVKRTVKGGSEYVGS